MSIKRKIPLLIASFVILSLALTCIFTYFESSKIVFNGSKTEMSSVKKRAVETISVMLEKEQLEVASLSSQKGIAEAFLSEDSAPQGAETKTLLDKSISNLQDYVKGTDYIEQIFFVDKQGTVFGSTNPALVGSSMSSMSFHTTTMAGNKEISETINSKVTGAKTLIFTSPILGNDKYGTVVGYVGLSIYAESFSKYLKEIKVGDTKSSYVYLVDEKGNIIYHKDKGKIGKPVEDPQIKTVVKQIEKGQKVDGAYTEYATGDKTRLESYDIIPKTSWVVVLSSDKDEVRFPIKTMTIVIIIINLAVLAIIIVCGMLASRRITDPIVKATELLDKTSNLDLENDETYDLLAERKDEIGNIFRSIGKMRFHLRQVVHNLIEASEVINKNVGLVEELTETLKIQTDETSSETEGLSAAMEETAATAKEVSATTSEIENVVNSIAVKAYDGSGKTNDIAERAKALREAALLSKENADKIYINVKKELETAINGAKAVQEIDKLAKSILDITSQTDLLALNAAIEAARAGEAGRGFAVVAEEVRKLAEQSAHTAATIQSVVKNVTSSVYNLTESASRILDFIDKNVAEDYDKFIDTGRQYNSDAEQFNDLMIEFSATSEELNAAVVDIVKAMNEVTATINDGARGTTNISNKTMVVAEKVENIKKSAEENLSSAGKLQEIISKFKI